jgi:hypothetical protein
MIFVCKIRIISKIKISLLSWVPNLNILRLGWLVGPNFKFCSKNYHQHCHETTYSKLIKRTCTHKLNIYRKLGTLFAVIRNHSMASTHGLNQADATPQLEVTIQRKRRHAISDGERWMIRQRAASHPGKQQQIAEWFEQETGRHLAQDPEPEKVPQVSADEAILMCLRDFVDMNFNRRME